VLQLLRPRCLNFAHSCIVQSWFLRRRLKQLVLDLQRVGNYRVQLPGSWCCAHCGSCVVVSPVRAMDCNSSQSRLRAGCAAFCWFRSGVWAWVALIA
jgi:ferredoxin